MSRRQGHLHLTLVLHPMAIHQAGWAHPESVFGNKLSDYVHLAQLAEKARFDGIFLADGPSMISEDMEEGSRHPYGDGFEPLTLLSSLSAVTSRLGLIATASSTYSEPYNVARQFASLDILSNGRAGFNLVTTVSTIAAANFGRTHPPHAERYERAGEFIEVLEGLWDSWEDDAFIHDREEGRYFDPAKGHLLNYNGKHFSVRGPLNLARPVQGHPVKVQAGASEVGKRLAARTADVVFTVSQTIEEAKAFYSDIKRLAAGYGRNPDHVRVLPGVVPFIGRTEEEAQEQFEYLQDLLHPVSGVAKLSAAFGMDLSGYPLDGPLPDLPATEASKGMQELLTSLARRENMTLRQLYKHVSGSFGHRMLIGTGKSVADQLEEWYHAEAADGYNIMFPYQPGGMEQFVEHVLPELQRRGVFRTEYEGHTLREHLGLPRPANRHAIRQEPVREPAVATAD
jgi:FMN-dependent oxidoreductase (nitrilotriacetate monooxygenase family)